MICKITVLEVVLTKLRNFSPDGQCLLTYFEKKRNKRFYSECGIVSEYQMTSVRNLIA